MTGIELILNGARLLHVSTALHPDDLNEETVILILKEVLYALEHPSERIPYHD